MPTILCYGDSNTWGSDPGSGQRLARETRWPGVLRRLLPDLEVVEEGLPGRTTVQDYPFEDGLNGLTYLSPCLASHAPVELVVLMLGTNDLKTFFALDAAGIAAGAGRLVNVIQRSACGPDGLSPQVLLVAPPPVTDPRPLQRIWGFSPTSAGRSRELAAYYRTVADDAGCAFLDGGAVASVSPADGVHLDEVAHRSLGTAIAAAIRSLIPPPGT